MLDGNDPTSLNYLVFFLVSMHFGTRGRQEHHQIRLEDLRVVRNTEGEVQMVEWAEGPTKTRQGGLKKKIRPTSQKPFPIGGPRCPVAAIMKLMSKRPSNLQDEGPLYLTPKILNEGEKWQELEVWFKRVPLGVNSIDKLMASIVKNTQLNKTEKRFTNHSLRKTTMTKLRKSGANETQIMAITGHKNAQSLADYDTIDCQDHRQLSHVLAGGQYSKLASKLTSTTSLPQHSTYPEKKIELLSLLLTNK